MDTFSQEIPFEWTRKRQPQTKKSIEAAEKEALAQNIPALPSANKKEVLSKRTCQTGDHHPNNLDPSLAHKMAHYNSVINDLSENTMANKENESCCEPSYILNASKAQSAPALNTKQSTLLFSPLGSINSNNNMKMDKKTPSDQRSALSNVQNRLKTPSSEHKTSKQLFTSGSSKRVLVTLSPKKQLNSQSERILSKEKLQPIPEDHCAFSEQDRISQLIEQPSQDDFMLPAHTSDAFCLEIINQLSLDSKALPVCSDRDPKVLFSYVSEKGNFSQTIPNVISLSNFNPC